MNRDKALYKSMFTLILADGAC